MFATQNIRHGGAVGLCVGGKGEAMSQREPHDPFARIIENACRIQTDSGDLLPRPSKPPKPLWMRLWEWARGKVEKP